MTKEDKDSIAYWEAYFAEDMADESGVTIMVNPYNKNGECIGDYEYEECFEGESIRRATITCKKFNAMKTKDLYDFYSCRD